MKTTLIVAKSKNNVIGANNKMLWHLPNDLTHFKNATKGHMVIMGRKTFESIGSKPLPNRINVIVTTNTNFKAEGCLVTSSLEEAIDVGKHHRQDEIFIIGGGQIYKEALEKSFVDKLLITEVDVEISGDTFFPTIEDAIFTQSESKRYSSDDNHRYSYSIDTYVTKGAKWNLSSEIQTNIRRTTYDYTKTLDSVMLTLSNSLGFKEYLDGLKSICGDNFLHISISNKHPNVIKFNIFLKSTYDDWDLLLKIGNLTNDIVNELKTIIGEGLAHFYTKYT